ncbi:hypothetical protein ABZW30_42340 [Kitasatospora sp. NPDC004669]|uniref:hypothetical protein n=1 Tax=Kitasatospora sp. NPDC004669 TaxID=3154555 RepID=UPI0033BDA71E
MSFSPGVNAATEPMLFGAPTCTVCDKELEWGGKGRRPKYCSKACSSRADRQREKERQEKALTEAAKAAENPRGETALPAGLASGPGAAELLALGDELRQQNAEFLLQLDHAARDGDEALARQALADVLHAVHVLTIRHRELAERTLAAHPTQQAEPGDAALEATVSPRGEKRPDAAAAQGPVKAASAGLPAPRHAAPGTEAQAETPRGETATPAMPVEPAPSGRQDRPAAAETPRGETPPAATDPATAPVTARGETPPAATDPATAPVTARGETPQTPAAGYGLRESAERRLTQQTEPSPAPATTPHTPNPPVTEVTVPTDPMLRRLPTTDVSVALDPRVFGDFWTLAGWTVNPDVYLVLGEGHQVGWVERALPGLEAGKWVAVYEGYFIGDQATQEAMLHDTPEQAARTVQLAYLQNL